jgi:hypothetical protein
MLNIGVIRPNRLSGLQMIGLQRGASRYSEMASLLRSVSYLLLRYITSGALRSGGAAVSPIEAWLYFSAYGRYQLHEPYADNPSTRGFMRIDQEVLTTNIQRFLSDGWQTVRNACLLLRISAIKLRF